jgi:hypothetical protein
MGRCGRWSCGRTKGGATVLKGKVGEGMVWLKEGGWAGAVSGVVSFSFSFLREDKTDATTAATLLSHSHSGWKARIGVASWVRGDDGAHFPLFHFFSVNLKYWACYRWMGICE